MFLVCDFVRRFLPVILGGVLAHGPAMAAPVDTGDQAGPAVGRWIEIFAANPANGAALTKALELGGPRAVIETLGAVPPTPAGQLAIGRARLETGDREGALRDLRAVPVDGLETRFLPLLGRLLHESGDASAAEAAWTSALEKSTGKAAVADEMLAAGALAPAIPLMEELQNEGSISSRIEWMEKLAETHAATGNTNAAARQWEYLASKLDPSHWRWEEFVKKANSAALAAGILESWDDRLKSAPADLRTLRWRAEIARTRGDPDLQIRLLRDALKPAPADQATRQALIDAAFAAGRHGEVEDIVRETASSNPREGVPLLAGLLVMTGRVPEAADLIRSKIPDPADRLDLLRKWNLREAVELELAAAVSADPASIEAAFALATHRMADARFDEAGQVFEKFSEADGKTRLRIAGFLRDHQCLSAAERWARTALDQEPVEAALLIADLLQSRGDLEAAKTTLLAACQAPLPEESLDRRLYELLRAIAAGDGESVRDAETKTFASGLAAAATRSPSAESWWRAARWASWNGDVATAIEYLQTAATHSPAPARLSRRLAAELERDGRYEEAIANIESIRDPSEDGAAADRRTRARLLVLIGDPESAIKDLSELRKARPGDWETARELALAQQAAGNFFGALDVWLAADASAPPDRRRELLRPLLSCFSRLGTARKGLDYLAARIASLPPGHERDGLIQTASIFAAENELDPAWVASRPAAAESEGPSSAERTRDRAGLMEAFESARRNNDILSARKSATLLRDLPDAGPDDDIRLAEILDGSPEAESAWRRVAARYPRDARTQRRTGDFFFAIQRPADALIFWVRSVELGGGSPQLSLDMARAALEAGDRSAALDACNDALRRIPSVAANLPGALPLPLAREAIESLPPGSPARMRLEAITIMGSLLAESPRREELIKDAPVGSPAEQAWLLASVGQYSRAASLIDPDNPSTKDAMAALLLSAASRNNLTTWADADPAARWTAVADAAGSLLEAGWEPSVDFPESLRDAPPFANWQIAESLARTGWLRAAASLARPDELAEADRPAAFFRQAGWLLALRQIDAAKDSLGRVISCGSWTPSWDSAAASALRALLLLTPESGREGIEFSARAATKNARDPAAAQHLETLLAAIRSDLPAVRRHAALLVKAWNSGPTPAAEAALREGLRLESWDLTAAARELYRAALDTPPHDPREKLKAARSLRDSIALTRISEETSTPAALNLLQDWAATGAHRRQLLASAARAHALGNSALALTLQESLFDPAEESSWELLTAWSTPHHPAPLTPLQWIETASDDERGTAPPGWLARYASLLANHGLINEASRFLNLCPDSPEKQAAMEHLTALIEGHPVSPAPPSILPSKQESVSLEEWEKREARGIAEPADSLRYAEALWKAGRRAEAIDVADAMHAVATVDPAIVYPLARFHLAVDRPDRAAALMDNPSLPQRIRSRLGPLRATLSRIYAQRGRMEDCMRQIQEGAPLENGVDPKVVASVLLSLYSSSGILPAMDGLSMGIADRRGTLLAAARQLIDTGRAAEAPALLAADPVLAASPDARALARNCPPGAPLTEYWNVVASSPIHAARLEAARMPESAAPRSTAPQ